MNKKKTMVVGYSGQDGSLLIGNLSNRGDEILGIGHTSCMLPHNFPSREVIDITNPDQIYEAINLFRPDEVYYLAAYHVSSEAPAAPIPMHEEFFKAQSVHVIGLVNCLSAIKDLSPHTRLFYASSSLIFSGENGNIQDETTPMTPQGIYGITKAQGMMVCSEFRKKHNVYASTGILYNHESFFRTEKFLSAKIIKSAIRISTGIEEKLEIGDLTSFVDWGYASDFVVAFQNILSLENSDDFIVSTGEAHSVKEFIEIVFEYFSLSTKDYIVVNENLLTRKSPIKIGDSSKLRYLTGWSPSFNFQDFVLRLIKDHESLGNSA